MRTPRRAEGVDPRRCDCHRLTLLLAAGAGTILIPSFLTVAADRVVRSAVRRHGLLTKRAQRANDHLPQPQL
jgi:hypothetical protein